MNSQVSFVCDYDSDSDCVIVAEFDAPSASDAGVATIYRRIVPDESLVPKEENLADDEAAHIDSFAFLEMAIYNDASTPVTSYSEDNGSIDLSDAVTTCIIPPSQGFEDNPSDCILASSDTPHELSYESKDDVPLCELRNRSRSMSPSFHGFSEEKFAAHPFLHYFEALQSPASPPFIGFEPSECFIHKIKDKKFSAAGLSRFGDQNIVVEAESNNVSSRKIDTRKPRKKSARAKKSSRISETATDCAPGPEPSAVDRIEHTVVSVPARKGSEEISKRVEVSDKDNCTPEAADIGVIQSDTRNKELHVVLHRCDIQIASVFSLASSVDENAPLNGRRVSVDNSPHSSENLVNEANFSSVAVCSNAVQGETQDCRIDSTISEDTSSFPQDQSPISSMGQVDALPTRSCSTRKKRLPRYLIEYDLGDFERDTVVKRLEKSLQNVKCNQTRTRSLEQQKRIARLHQFIADREFELLYHIRKQLYDPAPRCLGCWAHLKKDADSPPYEFCVKCLYLYLRDWWNRCRRPVQPDEDGECDHAQSMAELNIIRQGRQNLDLRHDGEEMEMRERYLQGGKIIGMYRYFYPALTEHERWTLWLDNNAVSRHFLACSSAGSESICPHCLGSFNEMFINLHKKTCSRSKALACSCGATGFRAGAGLATHQRYCQEHQNSLRLLSDRKTGRVSTRESPALTRNHEASLEVSAPVVRRPAMLPNVDTRPVASKTTAKGIVRAIRPRARQIKRPSTAIPKPPVVKPRLNLNKSTVRGVKAPRLNIDPRLYSVSALRTEDWNPESSSSEDLRNPATEDSSVGFACAHPSNLSEQASPTQLRSSLEQIVCTPTVFPLTTETGLRTDTGPISLANPLRGIETTGPSVTAVDIGPKSPARSSLFPAKFSVDVPIPIQGVHTPSVASISVRCEKPPVKRGPNLALPQIASTLKRTFGLRRNTEAASSYAKAPTLPFTSTTGNAPHMACSKCFMYQDHQDCAGGMACVCSFRCPRLSELRSHISICPSALADCFPQKIDSDDHSVS
ncbi:hypothetical protein QAD02_008123 [Eretmocerus hayati]|uniref:Uncharacterized protein n=1 Tax=Eretmocerus hayati TaxID=131215 RepID=A0ACC2N6Y7_9HYME|nr:hypothetical protein QAD02_008123 [Eretmocerus hayati]